MKSRFRETAREICRQCRITLRSAAAILTEEAMSDE